MLPGLGPRHFAANKTAHDSPWSCYAVYMTPADKNRQPATYSGQTGGA